MYEEEPTVRKTQKPPEITAKKLFKKTPERAFLCVRAFEILKIRPCGRRAKKGGESARPNAVAQTQAREHRRTNAGARTQACKRKRTNVGARTQGHERRHTNTGTRMQAHEHCRTIPHHTAAWCGRLFRNFRQDHGKSRGKQFACRGLVSVIIADRFA